MMITIRVDTTVSDALRALAPARFRRALRNIIARATTEVRAMMAVYPPEGPWNWPAGPGSRWYQRLWGPRWMRMDGTIGGRNTSEKLLYSWRKRTTPREGRVWTGVSYAPYVVGAQQAWFHRAHGWHTAEGVARRWVRDRAPVVVREEVAKSWRNG